MGASQVRVGLQEIVAILITTTAGSVLAGPFNLHTQITNYTFDNDTLGLPPPQSFPGSPDSIPQDVVYAVAPSTNGSILVNDAGTMSKAVVMTTADTGVGVSFVDTQMLVTGMSRAVLDFDIAVLDAPASGLGQAVGNAPNGQAFIIQTFNVSNSGRVFRFVAAPTSATGGIFGLRNNSNGDLIPIPGGSYTNGQTHHVQIFMNFGAQTVSAYLNGALSPNLTVPFVESGFGIQEFFIFQNGVAGDTNQVAWDNFIVFVPEPASLSMAALVGVMTFRRRRRC